MALVAVAAVAVEEEFPDVVASAIHLESASYRCPATPSVREGDAVFEKM